MGGSSGRIVSVAKFRPWHVLQLDSEIWRIVDVGRVTSGRRSRSFLAAQNGISHIDRPQTGKVIPMTLESLKSPFDMDRAIDSEIVWDGIIQDVGTSESKLRNECDYSDVKMNSRRLYLVDMLNHMRARILELESLKDGLESTLQEI